MFDLERGTSTAIAHPPWSYSVGAPVDWRGDTLWVKSPSAREYVYFTDGPAGLVASDRLPGASALQLNAAWCRAGDPVRRARASVHRTETDHAQFLVSEIDEHGEYRVGRIGWVAQPDRWLAVPPKVIDVAMAGDRFVALHEYTLRVHAADDGVVSTIAEGVRFLALDTFTPSEDVPMIAVLAATLDGRGNRLYVQSVPVG